MEALILRRLREGQGWWLCSGDPKKAGVWPVGSPSRSDLRAGMSASHRPQEPEHLEALWSGLEAQRGRPCPCAFYLWDSAGGIWGQECKIPVSLSSRKPGIAHGRCLTNKLSE